MLTILWTILVFLFAILLLVGIHEYGHFIVARILGVKVLRYSIGFGKPLWRWVSKHDIEYVVGMLPLGGYVKMLDEREGPVPVEQQPLAFNRKPLWIRTAVVLAGPLFNFLFAVLAYWLVFMVGINAKAPLIGAITPHSIAAVGGLRPNDEILAIDHQLTRSWRSVRLALLSHLGSKKTLKITVKAEGTQVDRQQTLNLATWHVDETAPEPIRTLGIEPFLPSFPAIISTVIPGSPAERAGLHAKDTIVTAGDVSVKHWKNFADQIDTAYDKPVKLVVERQGRPINLTVTPEAIKIAGKKRGRIGVHSLPVKWPEHLLRKERYGFWLSWGKALHKTWNMSALSLQLMGKMVVGKVSMRGVSGPIGIAQVARTSASFGWVVFVSFLALISIGLGILNLLPIPILDGGYLLYFLIEAIRGKPLSDEAQQRGIMIGLLFIVGLMGLAFYNDILRLLGA